jgi:uncharacterized RDD family membrane protein YckC
VPELILPAPLWRRLAAALYDALVLVALWMVASLAYGVARTIAEWPLDAALFRGVLFLIGLAYFGLSWTHGGQTLGMRAWRLQVRRIDGTSVHWPAALARYAFAWLAWLPLGLGVLWSAVDSRRRAWHDMGSGTELVLLPKQ